MKSLSVETPTHGRVLIEDPRQASSARRLLVGFHGYAQTAEDMLSELEQIPGVDAWTRVSIQGLHRFYTRGYEKIVSSWMTRQDRELAIADNIAYVDRVLDAVLSGVPPACIAYVGFSQGVAMAYRAAILGSHQAQAVVAIGGDIPPEVKTASPPRFPEVHIAAGKSDPWYTPDKLHADETFLKSIEAPAHTYCYDGGHEWTTDLREHFGRVLGRFV